MIYYLLCGILIVFSIVDGLIHSPKKSQFTGVFIAILLILFAGLRDQTGTDWFSYAEFYKYGSEDTEPGYMFINDFFSKSSLHFNLFLIFINCISLILIFLAFRKHAKLVGIAFLLYYCELYLYFNFSGMRQGLAISITLFSSIFILERKFFKFLCCIILAMSFHITSIIFIIAYFIPQKALKKQHYLLMISFFLTISIGVYSLTNIVSGNLGYKIKFYLELQEQEENIKFLFLIGTLKRFIIILMVIIFGNVLLKTNRTIFYLNVYLFGFGLYLSTYLISPDIGVRLSSYFLLFDVFLAGNLVYMNNSLMRRIVIIALFSMVALYKISTYVQLKTYIYNSILTIK